MPDDYLVEVERRCRRFQGCWDQGTSGTLAADAFRLLRERKELMSTMAELERANGELRAAVEQRIAAAEAACCEGVPSCTRIDTRGPMADPDQVEAEDEELFAGRCVNGMTQEAAEAAWAAIKGRYDEMHERIAAAREEQKAPPRVFSAAGPTTTAEAFPSPAEALLRTAAETVRQRRATYGPPTDHFRITVGLLNAAFTERLRARLEAGEPPFRVDDWPIIMLLDKVARDMGPRQSADTPIDLAGYAGTLAETRA